MVADILDWTLLVLILEHAPRLESLGVSRCRWFTDDCLMQLIEGQQRSGLISLRNLDILFTCVTPAGLRRALEQAPDTLGFHGRINIGCTRKKLLDDWNRIFGVSYVSASFGGMACNCSRLSQGPIC